MKKQFFYSRLDQLEDSYEGINQQYLSRLLFDKQNTESDVFDVTHPNYEKFLRSKPLKKLNKEFVENQKMNFVSCWITNHRESAGMWNLYSAPGSVAIKITHKHLTDMVTKAKESFSKKKNIDCVYYGKVQYKDYVDSYGVRDPDFKGKRLHLEKTLALLMNKSFEFAFDFANHCQKRQQKTI